MNRNKSGLITAALVIATTLSLSVWDHGAFAKAPQTLQQENRTGGRARPADPLIGVSLPEIPTAESDDKTLSPYFFVKSDDPAVDQLPLQSTAVSASIAGVIADVRVTQVYKNSGKKTLEAVYVFPASSRAAVYGMQMTIGERTITARCRLREEARREYEQAKQEGRSASLLEQQRPNVFRMNVANILPGDLIKVELRYTELLVPTEGVYEFVYPTVVGPRYSNMSEKNAPDSEKWVKNPTLHEGEAPSYAFDAEVSLSAGLPIQEVTSPSHKVRIAFEGPSLARVRPDESQKAGGNRDFILRYRLAGGKTSSGLLLFRGEEESFFLLMMQPPRRAASEAVLPREYIFVVDVSGSMNGFPLDTAKGLLNDLIGRLRPTDTFNVLLFASGSSLLSESSLPATPENISRAMNFIGTQRGGGGTEIAAALKRALAVPKTDGVSRSLLVVTDGYVHVEDEVFRLIRSELGRANLFAFGIGTAVNRHLIEGMARAGMGEPFIVTKPAEAPARAERLRQYVQEPLLTGLSLKASSFEATDLEPLHIPDLLAERPVIVFGKWHGTPQGTLTLTGRNASGPYSIDVDVSRSIPLTENAALKYLWARHRIAALSDENTLRENEARTRDITDLGLKYNLLTRYTSFVAVDTVRRANGEATTVQQPLPLPQGVSDPAVGGMAGGQTLTSRSMPVPSPANGSAREQTTVPIPGKTEIRTGGMGIVERELTVTDNRMKDAVLKTLRQMVPELESCHPSRQELPAGSRGKMTIKWTVNAKGKVKNVRVTYSDFMNRGMDECVVGKIRKLSFQRPPHGDSFDVTCTFSFEPQS